MGLITKPGFSPSLGRFETKWHDFYDTYLQNGSFDISEVSDIALILLLKSLAEKIILLSGVTTMPGYFNLPIFKPVEFGGFLLVARRAEDEVPVEPCKNEKR